MRVSISSSSSELIEQKYYDASKEILEFLAANNCDLNWGSGSFSIMGLSYNIFKNYKRKIYGYTSPKYVSDIENLQSATHKVYDTTFDLKKHIFDDADVILMLPGGIGTITEFLSYLEEVRSNDKVKPLILYNCHHHFDSTVALIDDLIKRGFNKPEIKDFFKVANTLEEFKAIFKEIQDSH